MNILVVWIIVSLKVIQFLFDCKLCCIVYIQAYLYFNKQLVVVVLIM